MSAKQELVSLTSNLREIGLKCCKQCGEVKQLSEFAKYSGGSGLRGHCRGCANQRWRELYSGNNQRKSKARGYNLTRLYGLSLEEYNGLLELQGNRCAICKRDASRWKYKLAVDHDHLTGVVHGLLCQPCNRALGYLENSEWLSLARIYLCE